MQIVRKGNRWCLTSRLVTVIMLTATLASCASAPGGNSGYTRGKLVYVPDDVLFRSSVTEASLARSGCTYTTSDPVKLRTLKAIVDRYDHVAAPVETWPHERRYALYLEQDDGAIDTLLFDRQYAGDQQRFGTWDDEPVVIDGTIAAALVQWAVDEHITQSNDGCQYGSVRK